MTTASVSISPYEDSCYFAYSLTCKSTVLTIAGSWKSSSTPSIGGIRANMNALVEIGSAAGSTVTASFMGTQGYIYGMTGAGYGTYQCSVDGGTTWNSTIQSAVSSSFSSAKLCELDNASASATSKIALKVVTTPIDILFLGWYTGEIATITIPASGAATSATGAAAPAASGSAAQLKTNSTASSSSSAPSSTSTASSTTKILGMSPKNFGIGIAVIAVILAIGLTIWFCMSKGDDEDTTATKAASLGVKKAGRRHRKYMGGGQRLAQHSSSSSEGGTSEEELWSKP